MISFSAVSQNYDFGEVSLEELEQKQHPLEPEANAAYLYRNHRVYYGSNFMLFTEIHERIKIYNKDGFDWATRKIWMEEDDWVSDIKAYTYNLQGGKIVKQKLTKKAIFEEDVNNYSNRTSFSMPAVTEGSVLEISYTINAYAHPEVLPLQFTIPLNRLEAKVDIPDFLTFKMYPNMRAPLQIPVKQSKENFKNSNLIRAGIVVKENVYEVEADNIPSLKREDYIDNINNYRAFIAWDPQVSKMPNVDVAEFTNSWEDVVEVIFKRQGFSDALNKKMFTSEVEEAVKGLIDPRIKAEAVYALLKEKVAWNGNYGTFTEEGLRKAWKNGSGNVADLNLILTSMLRASGLTAYPVLISTKDNGVPTFPTRKGFNYVITAVELAPEEYLLLDATEKTAGPGELPSRARNWQGRIVMGEEKSNWIDLMPDQASLDHTYLNYVLTEDLVLKGKVIRSITDLHAKTYRDKYLNLNEEEYLLHLQEHKGDILISDLKKDPDDRPGKEIRESYNFEISSAVEKINDRLIFEPLLFLAENENPFKADERLLPIFIDFPSSEKKSVNLIIPKGYQVEFLPESIAYNLNNGAGTYKFAAVQDKNLIRIESQFDLNSIVFNPQDYDALKAFFAKIVEKQTEAIILQKMKL